MTDTRPLAILSGVRVLSFTQFLLGPSGVQFIADLGADVVKIEPPGGKLWERNWAGCDLYLNGVSSFFLSTHRNQRSLTLDLKHPEGQAVARRLVERADVLVQNFRPGVMARLGLGHEAALALNPRLVYVSASGYGETIIPLAPTLLAGSSNLPGDFRRAAIERLPIWSCSVRGLACHPCCQERGALLPHLFTLTSPKLTTRTP